MIDENTLKAFAEAREYYRELLDGAKPLEPEVLTVDRINKLNQENAEMRETLKKVSQIVHSAAMPKVTKMKFQKLLEKYYSC